MARFSTSLSEGQREREEGGESSITSFFNIFLRAIPKFRVHDFLIRNRRSWGKGGKKGKKRRGEREHTAAFSFHIIRPLVSYRSNALSHAHATAITADGGGRKRKRRKREGKRKRHQHRLPPPRGTKCNKIEKPLFSYISQNGSPPPQLDGGRKRKGERRKRETIPSTINSSLSCDARD